MHFPFRIRTDDPLVSVMEDCMRIIQRDHIIGVGAESLINQNQGCKF